MWWGIERHATVFVKRLKMYFLCSETFEDVCSDVVAPTLLAPPSHNSL
jgi:hypothetical protein